MTKQIHIKVITNVLPRHLWQAKVLHLFEKPILSPINLLYHFDNTGFIKNNPHYWLIK